MTTFVNSNKQPCGIVLPMPEIDISDTVDDCTPLNNDLSMGMMKGVKGVEYDIFLAVQPENLALSPYQNKTLFK